MYYRTFEKNTGDITSGPFPKLLLTRSPPSRSFHLSAPVPIPIPLHPYPQKLFLSQAVQLNFIVVAAAEVATSIMRSAPSTAVYESDLLRTYIDHY